MTIYVGIDPDTKATGITILGPGDHIDFVTAHAYGARAEDRVVGMSEALRYQFGNPWPQEPVVVAVEWQAIRPGDKRPNDILNLAVVAGMALATAMAWARAPGVRVLTPLPVQWKGSIPKIVHQARIIAKLTTEKRRILQAIPSRDRSHVIDALGLAQWAKETFRVADAVRDAVRDAS